MWYLRWLPLLGLGLALLTLTSAAQALFSATSPTAAAPGPAAQLAPAQGTPTPTPTPPLVCALIWSVVPDPSVGGFLTSVAAVAANDVWAVGRFGSNPDNTHTEHWDGSS